MNHAKKFLSRRALFSMLALMMLVIVVVFVTFSVRFIAENINTALTTNMSNVHPDTFDINGFEALKLGNR